MNTCTNCIHWIGEPVCYCELGPNQYPSCLEASIEAEDSKYDYDEEAYGDPDPEEGTFGELA